MAILGPTCDGSCGDHIRMSVLGTTYVCQFWVAHEDGISGDHVMAVLGPTCDISGGEDIRMLVLWTKCDGNSGAHMRWQL